jgi:predicted nuclease of restriction endonuclease-like (RecB) superfamily
MAALMKAAKTVRRAQGVALAPRKASGRGGLFARVSEILEQARGRVAREVNRGTVAAYWLIGREIVNAVQGGSRATYGGRVLEALSARLTARYGQGYSLANLKSFRQFYLAYAERRPEIGSPAGSQSVEEKSYLAGSQSAATGGFEPALSWSHYRALMRVDKPEARTFYELEAAACGWSKAQLERQIETLTYERLLLSRDKKKALRELRKKVEPGHPLDALKDPYVLEFLELPNSPTLRESALESAIIANLQQFLLELGKGFSFVARQKRMRYEDEDFYIDLVFYNYLLKCFVLIDLKVGKLTHQDIGQMDSYVRMFEAHERLPGDNPPIGLILCSSKNAAVAKYSVLAGSKQLFSARYVTYLPSEEELRRELERERRLLEARRGKG